MKHEEMKDLVLVFEDLVGEDKSIVESHLSDCSPCRDLLSKLQKAEKMAAGMGDLPADPSSGSDPLQHLDSQELTEAQASRRELVQRIKQQPVGSTGSSLNNRWGRSSSLFGFALAAGLALIIWLPRPSTQTSYIQGFRMTPPTVVRGEEVPLASSETFVMRFKMGVEGWPVVFRFPPNQSPQLVFPTVRDPALRLPADRGIVLPPPGSKTIWVTDEAGSSSVYLVAVSQDQEPDIALLQTFLQDAATATDPLAALQDRLQDDFGNCARY